MLEGPGGGLDEISSQSDGVWLWFSGLRGCRGCVGNGEVEWFSVHVKWDDVIVCFLMDICMNRSRRNGCGSHDGGSIQIFSDGMVERARQMTWWQGCSFGKV